MQRGREAVLHILWVEAVGAQLLLPLMLAYPFPQCFRAWQGVDGAKEKTVLLRTDGRGRQRYHLLFGAL